jgi:hypothetical protein
MRSRLVSCAVSSKHEQNPAAVRLSGKRKGIYEASRCQARSTRLVHIDIAAWRPQEGRLTGWLELRQVTIRKDDLDTDQVISGEPVFLPRISSPPPSVSPAIPTNAQVPAGRARPCSSSDADIRPNRVPGPTVATPPRDKYRSHRRNVDHEPTAHRASGEAMASTASHTPIRADPQKDQTGLPFSINITAGADRKLPLRASFGSCPPYGCTRRSTDPYKDRSAQKTGSVWRDRPRHHRTETLITP